MSYCEVADVKEALGITVSTYDARIGEYIAVAGRWIDEHCLYSGVTSPFAITGDSTRYFTCGAVRGRYLYTDVPFVSITSVTNGDGATIASSNYRTEPRNSERYHCIRLNYNYDWRFNDEDSEIAIVGKFGYSELPPMPVAEACRHYAGWMHQRWQAGLNRSSSTNELGTVREVMQVPGEVKSLLAPFVHTPSML